MNIDREEFGEALARVKPALKSGGVLQELTHFWFDTKTVSAYDGGFGIRLKLASDINCGVPGAALMGLLSTSVLKEAALEPSGAALHVKLGRSTSKLVTLEADRTVWPFPEKLPRKADPTELDEAFMEALRRTLFVRASPPTRVEHHGVMVVQTKKDLTLYATDSASLVTAVVKGAGAGASFEKTLLPRDFAEQLVAQAPEGAKLYVLDDCLIAQAEGVSFYSNVLDISGADDMGAIVAAQTAAHPEAVALPAGLEGALSRAEVLAGRDEPKVTVSAERGGLKVTGEYGLGQLKEELELEKRLPDAKVQLKAGLIRRGLAHAETFSVTKDSLFLRGNNGFGYLVASL